MGLDVGIPNVINTAHAAGIPADLVNEVRGGLALGDQGVHPIDMASAFATFAADGKYREPYIVSKVTAADGRVLYEHDANPGEQRIPQQVARNVTEAMLDVAKSSSIPLAGGRAVAAKTGTVQQSGRDNKDAWTVGYTPSLSTAVWVGSDASDAIRDSRNRPIYGRMLPGQMWQEFMNNALKGTPKESFSRFVPMGTPPVDNGAGGQPSTTTTSTPPTSTPNSSNQNGGNGGNSGSNGSSNGNSNRNNSGNSNGNGNGNGSSSGNGGSGGLFGIGGSSGSNSSG